MAKNNATYQIKEKIIRKIGMANNAYNLIEKDDRILVALSGGVDSFVLLHTIHSRLKFLPIRYTIEAIHVQNTHIPDKTNTELLHNFCDTLKVPLHFEKTSIQPREGKQKNMCFPCSWNRRKKIFQKAQESGFNKVAMGHHMDDALETLLMNMVNHGEFSAIPPKLFMKKGQIEIIRPLILVNEQDIKTYARHFHIQNAEYECPYENENKRAKFKEIVQEMSQLNDQGKINLFNSMTNLFPEYLPPRKPK